MKKIKAQIAWADGVQIEELLFAGLKRYAVLFPDWEISTVSIDKREDRCEQIDRIIQVLETMKTMR